MKKILITGSVFFCCFFISCNNNGDPGENKNIATAKEIFKGIETGDSTKLSSIPADAVDHAGPTGEVTSGDSIKSYLLDIHNHVKDLKFEILGNGVDGDYVYSWVKMTGTPVDSSMHLPVGIPISVKSVELIKFRDGKAAEHWTLNDQQDMMMMQAAQAPNATIVKVTMGDTSSKKKDSTKK